LRYGFLLEFGKKGKESSDETNATSYIQEFGVKFDG
jgi:hypothetical protein